MRVPYFAGLLVLTACAVAHAGSASYNYDALGRLGSAVNSNGVNANYQYDPLGNFSSRVIATPPSAPPTVTGSSIGDGTVAFTFVPPSIYTGAVITGYVASCTPGPLSASVSASATSVAVSGLTKGTTYTCTLTPNSAVGLGPPSATQMIIGGSQTISFGTSVVWNGITQAMPVTASSGLPVSLATTTPTVCTVLSGTTVRGLTGGSCTLTATQAGDSSFLAAPSISVTLPVLSPAVLFGLFGDDI